MVVGFGAEKLLIELDLVLVLEALSEIGCFDDLRRKLIAALLISFVLQLVCLVESLSFVAQLFFGLEIIGFDPASLVEHLLKLSGGGRFEWVSLSAGDPYPVEDAAGRSDAVQEEPGHDDEGEDGDN